MSSNNTHCFSVVLVVSMCIVARVSKCFEELLHGKLALVRPYMVMVVT